jgi:hypothetical protein
MLRTGRRSLLIRGVRPTKGKRGRPSVRVTKTRDDDWEVHLSGSEVAVIGEVVSRMGRALRAEEFPTLCAGWTPADAMRAVESWSAQSARQTDEIRLQVAGQELRLMVESLREACYGASRLRDAHDLGAKARPVAKSLSEACDRAGLEL